MATENIIMDAVKLGKDRQEMHEEIRRMSMEAGRNVKEKGEDNNLLSLIAENPNISLSEEDLKHVTEDLLSFVGRAPRQTKDYLKEVVGPLLEENKDLLGATAEINV